MTVTKRNFFVFVNNSFQTFYKTLSSSFKKKHEMLKFEMQQNMYKTLLLFLYSFISQHVIVHFTKLDFRYFTLIITSNLENMLILELS